MADKPTQSKKMMVDVSGKNGLTIKYYGDVTSSVNQPYLRYLKGRYIGGDSQMADGIFNPYIRDGYLSPANQSFESITTPGISYQDIKGSLIDPIEQVWKFIGTEEGSDFRTIYPATNEGTTVTTTDLSSTSSIPTGTPGNGILYTVYGIPAIFYVTSTNVFVYYPVTSTPGGGVWDTGWLGGTIQGSLTLSGTYSSGDTSIVLSGTSGLQSAGVLYVFDVNGQPWLFHYSSHSGTTLAVDGPSWLPMFGQSFANFANGAKVYQGPIGPAAALVSWNQNRLVKYSSMLYVLNKNYLWQIDGTLGVGGSGPGTSGSISGTFGVNNYSSLQLSGDEALFDGVEYQDSLALTINTIGNNPSNELESGGLEGAYPLPCYVAFWNGQGLGFTNRVFVPGMRALKNIFISPKGTLRLFAVNNVFETCLMEYDGTKFNIIQIIGVNSYPSLPDSLASTSEKTYWLGRNGTLYSYGSSDPWDSSTYGQEGLNKLFDFPTLNAQGYSGGATVVLPGAITISQYYVASPPTNVRQYQESIIFGMTASVSGSNVFNLWRYLPNNTQTLNTIVPHPNVGNVYSMVKLMPTLSEINYIRSIHLPTGSAGSTTQATVYVYYNNSSTASETFVINQTDVSRGWKYMKTGKTKVNSIQFMVAWNSSTTLGVQDYCPYLMEIDYEPTSDLT